MLKHKPLISKRLLLRCKFNRPSNNSKLNYGKHKLLNFYKPSKVPNNQQIQMIKQETKHKFKHNFKKINHYYLIKKLNSKNLRKNLKLFKNKLRKHNLMQLNYQILQHGV